MEDRSSIVDSTTTAASNALVATMGFYTKALEEARANGFELQVRLNQTLMVVSQLRAENKTKDDELQGVRKQLASLQESLYAVTMSLTPIVGKAKELVDAIGNEGEFAFNGYYQQLRLAILAAYPEGKVDAGAAPAR